MTKLNIFGLVDDTIVDGPGLRFGVFVQGCTHACPGCHNPNSQPVEGGASWDIDDVIERIVANKIIRDVTISGGEPFEQVAACAELAAKLKARGYGIWTYTGYLYEELLTWEGQHGEAARTLLESSDVLVDGPFVLNKKSFAQRWCGSSNQRVIDLRRTREENTIVLYEHDEGFPVKPVAW